MKHRGGRRRAETSRGSWIARAGYTALIVLLFFSVFASYRIQMALSEQNLEIYRHYVKQDEAFVRLRSAVWRGSVAARDFFLSPQKSRGAELKSQVESLRKECLAQLGELRIPGRDTADLRAVLSEYWSTLDDAAGYMVGATGMQAYEFAQREIVPRRDAASSALRELTVASREAVEASEQEFSQKRRDAVRQIAIMLVLALLVGITVAAFSIRRTEKLQRELVKNYESMAEARRDLQQLSSRLIQVQEEERARLSRELHDEIGQILTAVRMEISRAIAGAGQDPSEVSERLSRLSRARGLAEKAIQIVRDISLLLRPSALDDLGLIPALQSQLDDFSRRSGIQCEFSEEGVQETLSDEVKTCAYRSVQEAINNCEKYSSASQLRVRIEETPSEIRIDIKDNGKGLELGAGGMPARRKGSGLLWMRERIGMLGGRLAIESAPGAGLRISISIPLPGSAPVGNAGPGPEGSV
jgi:signal transduction histidine kinase